MSIYLHSITISCWRATHRGLDLYVYFNSISSPFRHARYIFHQVLSALVTSDGDCDVTKFSGNRCSLPLKTPAHPIAGASNDTPLLASAAIIIQQVYNISTVSARHSNPGKHVGPAQAIPYYPINCPARSDQSALAVAKLWCDVERRPDELSLAPPGPTPVYI